MFNILLERNAECRNPKTVLFQLCLVTRADIARRDIQYNLPHLILGPATMRALRRPLRQFDRARLV